MVEGNLEGDLTTTPLPVEKRRKAQDVTTKGIVKAGNLDQGTVLTIQTIFRGLDIFVRLTHTKTQRHKDKDGTTKGIMKAGNNRLSHVHKETQKTLLQTAYFLSCVTLGQMTYTPPHFFIKYEV